MTIRLAEPAEPGMAFGDMLNERLGRSGASRVLAFVLAWDRLRDELGRPPSPEELAKRFGWDRSTAYRDLELFRKATGQEGPERIAVMLWEGLAEKGGIGALLSVRLAETGIEQEVELAALADWEPDLSLDQLDDVRRARTTR